MSDRTSDSFENKGNHSLIRYQYFSHYQLPIHISTDNRTCTQQPNAAVKVISYNIKNLVKITNLFL